MSQFAYRSPSPYRNWVRLVELLPETSTSSSTHWQPISEGVDPNATAAWHIPVSCLLHDVSFDDGEGNALPSYTALSYCWGPPFPTTTIYLNGMCFKVAKRLEVALRQLRVKETSLLLWIDAICIDQSNDEEKAEQVKKMGQIFQRASTVLAWIGPQRENSDLAMDWIARVDDPTAAVEHPFHEENQDLKDALLQLFGQPYWDRIWIVQELVQARTLLYRCGRKTVTESQLRRAVNILRGLKYEFWDQCRNAQNAVMLRTHAGRPPLIFLLRTFRHFQASLDQDKIFALLGLARDMRHFLPNYSMPCEALYTAFARTLLESGYVEILSLCEARRRQHNDMSLPSWVPDWSRKGDRDPLQQRELETGSVPLQARLEPTYNACGPLEWDAAGCRTANATGGNILRVEAIFIGKVKRLGPIWKNHPGKWLDSILRLATRVEQLSDNPGPRLDAVLRTAVADQQLRVRDENGIKRRMEQSFFHDVRRHVRRSKIRDLDKEDFSNMGIWDYYQQIWCLAWGRRAFITESRIGLGPVEAQKGDFVCIIHGSGMPFVVRPMKYGQYTLVGEAYVDEAMDGEALAENPVFEPIELV